jgi:hypothetical protein
VCKKDEFMQWHKQYCLFSEWDKCGVNLLPLCPKETKGSDDYVVIRRRFVLGQTMSVVGKLQKKLSLIHNVILVHELNAYLKPKLQYFVHHNFIANWRDM